MRRGRTFHLPEGFEWHAWIERWDRMQEYYLVRRAERFETIIAVVGATQPTVERVISLGCGPGSLMVRVLEAFPQAAVLGIDLNPAILALGRERLARFGERAQLVLADLRDVSWSEGLRVPVDAVVSATALHWLGPGQLTALYHSVARILRPGGILINADHVGSTHPDIQAIWERRQAAMRAQTADPDADDWDTFWAAFADELDLDLAAVLSDDWESGVEEGLPLVWHLDRLRESGFRWVDCFWRCDCDAIYGGIL